jgi:Protein of unknown function (DUF4238)
MSVPKLHHYVPQFYLKRFTDAKGWLWAWNKSRDLSFSTNPARVAAETNFYRMQELADAGHDPYTMEIQLSDLEGQVSLITDQWLDWLSDVEPGTQIPIPEVNREEVSLYIAVQYLRTADTKDILCALRDDYETLSEAERTRLHTTLMWDLRTVHMIRDRIKESIWIFGRNTAETPFVTSDNPVAFRTPDNRQWRRLGILDTGMYVVHPLSPKIVMYCHERTHWEKMAEFDSCLSPINFDSEMVESENSGQVFMASRFVFSPENDFEHARKFARSIGTDLFAPR